MAVSLLPASAALDTAQLSVHEVCLRIKPSEPARLVKIPAMAGRARKFGGYRHGDMRPMTLLRSGRRLPPVPLPHHSQALQRSVWAPLRIRAAGLSPAYVR